MRISQLTLAMMAFGFSVSAFATNGYFSHGNGMTAKGMAGTATAMTKDTFGGANNPATMVWVGNRIDGGFDAFSPIRDTARTGSTVGMNVSAHGSDNELFAIPEFGYNTMINDRMSMGVSVYGNGGMNTDYSAGTLSSPVCAGFGGPAANANILCGSTALGVDLMQLIIAPTFAYKVSDTASVGIAPLLGYQRFSATGLQAFAGFSSDANNLTNKGYDSATGFGVRVGGFAKLNNMVSVGAAYATKVNMDKFDKYKGLFAEQGDFDMPANWNVGLAFQISDAITLAVDYQHIAYSDVKSVGNPSSHAAIANSLGGADGRGFGWSDVDVFKLGIEYKMKPGMTLRAGYSHTDSPIQGRDVTFNILAPAVIEDHLSLGMTYAMDKDSDLTVSYTHAFENSLTAASLYETYAPGAGNDTIKMHQDTVGLSYSKRF